jgi:hypothetical protein
MLRYRFASWLVAKGLSIFLRKTIVPKKYQINVSENNNSLLLSHIFASQVLNTEMENMSESSMKYISLPKSITVAVSNPLFSMYIHFTKCLFDVYGDSAPLVDLNDAIFVRGIASFYEDMLHGNIPIVNKLPDEEAAVMKRLRLMAEAELKKQTELYNQSLKNKKEVVN